MDKKGLKRILGEIPLTAELYGYLRQTGKPPVGGYSLKRLEQSLPGWLQQAREGSKESADRRHVLIFSMLRYWIEHTSLMGLALRALGHEVTLAYLPYQHWKKPINTFDLRRQSLYVSEILTQVEPFLDTISMLEVGEGDQLPDPFLRDMETAAFRDVQYSLLREDVSQDNDLYKLRLERNTTFARVLMEWMRNNSPDVLILPNGSILEFGVAFQVARYLNIPTVTFEFGEQSERMWMAQNADVMRQETDEMWDVLRDVPLVEREWERVRDFFTTRQGGGLWENFSRRWQGTTSQGGEQVRSDLGLGSRPIAFLPTNVLGDSLTLGRHIFSESMTEWLKETIDYFCDRSDWQLVIRVHPGEQLGWGPSVYDILREIYPQLPNHVYLLPADAEVNSYDLVEIAELGLVFTTTLGMEMAMSGLPVIVAGETHYRDKGFTLDPDSWKSYNEILGRVLESPAEFRPSREDVEKAWRYAYRFFFEYPQPYPWHVQYFWKDVERWPLERVLSKEGMELFSDTFRYLVGERIVWKKNTERV